VDTHLVLAHEAEAPAVARDFADYFAKTVMTRPTAPIYPATPRRVSGRTLS
jgi:hypothetical protein